MSNDTSADEARMRAALQLLPGSKPRPPGNRPDHGSQRHRFVRDGDVAVTFVHAGGSDHAPAQSSRSRLTAVEDALAVERTSHARTARALEKALATIQALETTRAHEELAHAEEIRHEQVARAEAETVVSRLQAQLKEAEADARQLAAAATKTPRLAEPATPTLGLVVSQRQKTIAAKKAKPVKWWLPSYQATKRQR